MKFGCSREYLHVVGVGVSQILCHHHDITFSDIVGDGIEGILAIPVFQWVLPGLHFYPSFPPNFSYCLIQPLLLFPWNISRVLLTPPIIQMVDVNILHNMMPQVLLLSLLKDTRSLFLPVILDLLALPDEFHVMG